MYLRPPRMANSPDRCGPTRTLSVRPEVPEDAARGPRHIPAVVHILDPENERPDRARGRRDG